MSLEIPLVSSLSFASPPVPIRYFDLLPPELVKIIIQYAVEEPSTSFSLCLVSKSIRAITTPLLYRSLDFYLVSWEETSWKPWEREFQEAEEEEEEGEDDDDEEDLDFTEDAYRLAISWQAAQCELLEDRQEWKSYVRTVSISSIYGQPAFGEPKLARLLSTLPHLLHFSINTLSLELPLGEIIDSFLVECCPSTVVSLDLRQGRISSSAVLEILKKVPSLESLSLSADETEGSFLCPPNEIPPELKFLETLKLSRPFRSRSFFSVLTISAVSLTSLDINFISVQSLELSRLSSLQSLRIVGERKPRLISRSFYPEDLDLQLVSVFESCTSLKRLTLHEYDLPGSDADALPLENIHALHRLPPSLECLSLLWMNFGARYLLDYLNFAATSIHRLIVKGNYDPRRGIIVYDSTAEREIREVCIQRDISLSWLDDVVGEKRWAL
ncbi:hypothetical protein JCM5350_005353 [Sporobolomyces pararoseus]